MSDLPDSNPRKRPDEDEAVRVCHGVLWLADNIHNYGTKQWRGYFMACVRDARRVVGYDPETPQEEPACICPRFSDLAEGTIIADLTCPVHGVNGTDPGDVLPPEYEQ